MLAAAVADPILSFSDIIDDLGVSPSTFYRVHRPQLPVVATGIRRRGVRQSTYLAYKATLEVNQPMRRTR